jgi:putative tryptophan/tyrosine transport system substrate-binding protein
VLWSTLPVRPCQTTNPFRYFIGAGGFVAYGLDVDNQFRARSLENPVQQRTKVELVTNLKTGKALALTVPPTLLARADEVIE